MVLSDKQSDSTLAYKKLLLQVSCVTLACTVTCLCYVSCVHRLLGFLDWRCPQVRQQRMGSLHYWQKECGAYHVYVTSTHTIYIICRNGEVMLCNRLHQLTNERFQQVFSCVSTWYWYTFWCFFEHFSEPTCHLWVLLLKAVRRIHPGNQLWVSSKSEVICSDHFQLEDFASFGNGTSKLLKLAVPAVGFFLMTGAFKGN